MAEKIIPIYSTDVKFKITGFTPLMYQTMYGADFLKDFNEMQKAQLAGEAPNTLTLYQIIYCLAKKADSNIPSMEEWFDSFEDGFPIADVLQEISPLILANIATTVKKSRATKTK